MTGPGCGCHRVVVNDDPRILVVMRHAEAEQIGRTDLERELTERGVADATGTGHWLARAEVVPERALVSSAIRAVQTWETAAAAAEWTLSASVDPGLYNADAETILDLLRATEDSVTTLVVVGHNPAVASLANLLDDGEGDDLAGVALLGGFPAGSAAVFEYDGSWAELDWATASVAGFHSGGTPLE